MPRPHLKSSLHTELQAVMSHQRLQFSGYEQTRMHRSRYRFLNSLTSKRLDFEDNIHATANSDFTAKSLAEGLKPGSLYYYRFIAGQTVSEIGIFRTAPQENKKATVHFTWSGDTDVSEINGVPVFGDWSPLQVSKIRKSKLFYLSR